MMKYSQQSSFTSLSLFKSVGNEYMQYSDVIMSVMASQTTGVLSVSQPFIQA